LSLYIGVQSSSWGISAEGDIAVGTVVRDHLAAVNAERYEAATQNTTKETDACTDGPGHHSTLRHSPGGDGLLTVGTDSGDGSVTEDITCHGWRCDHLHHLWVGSGSVVGLLWLLHVVENIIVIISTFT